MDEILFHFCLGTQMTNIFVLRTARGIAGTLVDREEYSVIVTGDVYDDEDDVANLTPEHCIPVDSPLRMMSSMPYLIFKKNSIIYGHIEWKIDVTIPYKYRWKILPIIKEGSIVSYVPHRNDIPFINAGYAAEVRDAKYIVLYPGYQPSIDLLIREYGPEGYISYSGRILHLDDAPIEGRYIYLTEEPYITGERTIDVPYTYTHYSLKGRYDLMQDRLNIYGSYRLDSINEALVSIPDLLMSKRNNYKTSSIYEDVCALIAKIKNM